jgi:uncharacterized membrane protein
MKKSRWYAQLSWDDNLLAITKNLVYRANIKVSAVGFDRLVEHPDYPSLSALKALLNWLKVSNKAVRLELPKLDSLAMPAVAYMEGDDQRFVLLLRCNVNSISYIDSQRGEITVDKDSFGREWSGIVHLIAPDSNAGEPNFQMNRLISIFGGKTGAWGAGIILLALICSTVNLLTADTRLGTVTSLVWMSTILLGLYASIAGFLTERRLNSPLFDAVCPVGQRKLGKNTKCQAVMQAGNSGLFEKFSIGEIGMTYFLFLLLMACLAPLWGSDTTHILAILSWLAMPCVIVALWYQWQTAKKWCVVCLLVHGSLVSQAVLWFFLMSNVRLTTPDTADLLGLILTMFTVGLWLFLREYLVKGFRYKQLRTRFERLRRRPAILKHLATLNSPIIDGVDSSDLVFGDHDSPHTLILGLSPFCIHCASLLTVVNSSLLPFNRIRIVLRFLIPPNANKSYLEAVRQLLTALISGKDSTCRMNLLDLWYAKKILDWPGDEQVKASKRRVDQLITNYQEWTRLNALRHSPFLVLNGRPLDEAIEFDDLPHLLRAI